MHAFFDDLRRDAAYGVRVLVKNRGFAAVAVLTLALGIGATSAIFTVLNSVVFAPLPFRDPEQLVWIASVNGEGRPRAIPLDTTEAWRKETKTLTSVAYVLMGQANFTVTGPAGAERVLLEQVDFYTLDLLGVRPILGRWFQPDDVIVQGNTSQGLLISYGTWQRIFGGDPNVVGKKVPGFTAGWGDVVIGVMPRGFYTHPSRSDSDGWYVIAALPGRTLGRLAPGVAPEQAQAELDGIARGLHPPSRAATSPANTWRLQVSPLHTVYRSGYAQTLYMLLGAVAFVLLIAAANVANLQLNRGVTRQTEIATRIALGAGRWRVFRQLVIENIILVLLGGGLGVLVALIGIRLFVVVAPTFYPPSDEIGIDRTVLLFTLAVSLVTGLLSGVVPGLRASKLDLQAVLKQGGRGADGGARLGLRRFLVVLETSLAMVLLVGAGLMMNSYAHATSVEMGLDPDNVLRTQIILMGMDRYRTRFSGNHYAATPAVARYYTQALEQLAALPGVESVGMSSVLPPGGGFPIPFRIIGGGQAPGDAAAQYHEVSENFFSAIRVPLIRGRMFSDRDGQAGPRVAIVNDAFARRFFGGADPLGQSIQANINGANPQLEDDRVREIVGVVGNVRMDFRAEFAPIVYVPYGQHLTDYAGNGELAIHTIKHFAIRAAADPMSLAASVRRVFAAVDSNVAIGTVVPMRSSLSLAAGAQAFWMRLLGIFAGLGVFLAAVGIYGVIAYSVQQRTREFGIRATLGARNADILKLVLWEGIAVSIAGLVIGIGGAFAATRLIQNQLFGVSRMDPTTIAVVGMLLLGVSIVACLIPARRTAKLDPVLALRSE
jgi:putative ABC transport system permease protein